MTERRDALIDSLRKLAGDNTDALLLIGELSDKYELLQGAYERQVKLSLVRGEALQRIKDLIESERFRTSDNEELIVLATLIAANIEAALGGKPQP